MKAKQPDEVKEMQRQKAKTRRKLQGKGGLKSPGPKSGNRHKTKGKPKGKGRR